MSDVQTLQMVMFHAFKAKDPAMEAQIAMAARSVREHYPEAEIVLLTNMTRADADLPDFISVRPEPVDQTQIMFERARRYRDHIRTAVPASVVVFMDTDMLVVRRFDELLMPGADIAVTVRRLRLAPVNGGLIVVNNLRHVATAAFFERFVAAFGELTPDERKWDGDQTVLARLLNAPTDGPSAIMHATAGDLTIRFAPVRVFNNTPRSWLLRLGLFRPGARLLHFKGRRKGRMPLYARRFLSPLYLAYSRFTDRHRGAGPAARSENVAAI